jgi:hypothetical protein
MQNCRQQHGRITETRIYLAPWLTIYATFVTAKDNFVLAFISQTAHAFPGDILKYEPLYTIDRQAAEEISLKKFLCVERPS